MKREICSGCCAEIIEKLSKDAKLSIQLEISCQEDTNLPLEKRPSIEGVRIIDEVETSSSSYYTTGQKITVRPGTYISSRDGRYSFTNVALYRQLAMDERQIDLEVVFTEDDFAVFKILSHDPYDL